MKSAIITIVYAGLLYPAMGQIRNTPDQIKPLVLGETHQIYSTILSEERTLNIYLPEGYHADDTTRYAVAYLLDGGAEEDFIHVAGLYQFNTFPWVNRAPGTIVVGIGNTDRRRDFTFPTSINEDRERFPTTGGSARFMQYIEEEVKPYVTMRFRMREDKTLIGQSLGGLLATEILLKHPSMFDRYIIISPSLWWDDGSLLKASSDLLLESFTQPMQVYIGVGKEGLAPCTIPHVMEVDANLLAEKLKSSKSRHLRVYFDYLPEENHATMGHQAVANGVKLINQY